MLTISMGVFIHLYRVIFGDELHLEVRDDTDDR